MIKLEKLASSCGLYEARRYLLNRYPIQPVVMHCLVRGAALIPRLSLHLIARNQSATNGTWLYCRQGAPFLAARRPLSSDTDFKPSEELAKERYDSRANEDTERKRARLLYQSRKRGMLENGVILASFANKYLSTFDAEQLDQYDRLINLPTNDWDIYYWATNTKPTPQEFETPVLTMLREHLKSKVSNEETGKMQSDSVLGKSKLNDIVLPTRKKRYDLEIDPNQIDLANYKDELFDERIKKYRSGKSITLMTSWRKRMFERQLKRVVSSPTSLKALNDDDEEKSKVYTQKVEKKDIASNVIEPRNIIDSKHERAMKHHHFMQHLLSNQLTDDALEYDDEAEAWANMLWCRDYGTDDDKISPSRNHKCKSCHFPIHCCDSSLGGYVPREILVSIDADSSRNSNDILCQKCKFKMVYNAELSYDMSPDNYVNFLREIGREKSPIIIVLVDLTDFPAGIWEGLVDLVQGQRMQYLIVGNKLDLLPYDGPKLIDRVHYALRENLDRLRPGNGNKRISDTTVLSARTGFGVEGLVSRILERMDDEPRDVYLVGSKGAGKSTLFNALLQSDLCAARNGDLVTRVSSYEVPGHRVRMLRFPIDKLDSWQVEMKKRKRERVERNTAERIHALSSLSQRRQDSMPHMSTIINRLDYNPLSDSSTLTFSERSLPAESAPKFTDDHPLANIEDGKPLAATKEKYSSYGFFHETPSSCHPDQLRNILTNDERLEVFPNETIVPRKYSIRPLNTIFIAGLARLDLLTSQSNVIFTVFASKYLPVHVVQTKKADKFYNQFLGTPYLGVPFGDDVRLAAWPGLEHAESDFHIRGVPYNIGAADIVFSSFAWMLVNVSRDQECIVRAFTPGGKGIFLREPPLLSRAHRYSLGPKIRDTPVFKNPHYITESKRIRADQQ